jgi:hypothetical protein
VSLSVAKSHLPPRARRRSRNRWPFRPVRRLPKHRLMADSLPAVHRLQRRMYDRCPLRIVHSAPMVNTHQCRKLTTRRMTMPMNCRTILPEIYRQRMTSWIPMNCWNGKTPRCLRQSILGPPARRAIETAGTLVGIAHQRRSCSCWTLGCGAVRRPGTLARWSTFLATPLCLEASVRAVGARRTDGATARRQVG